MVHPHYECFGILYDIFMAHRVADPGLGTRQSSSCGWHTGWVYFGRVDVEQCSENYMGVNPCSLYTQADTYNMSKNLISKNWVYKTEYPEIEYPKTECLGTKHPETEYLGIEHPGTSLLEENFQEAIYRVDAIRVIIAGYIFPRNDVTRIIVARD